MKKKCKYSMNLPRSHSLIIIIAVEVVLVASKRERVSSASINERNIYKIYLAIFLPSFSAAKNRTSSSPSFLQQQSKISSVSSSSSFKREASPTVCCYSIGTNNNNNNNFYNYNRSQVIRNRQKNENEKKILTRENCENARNIASYNNNAQSNIPVPSPFESKFNNNVERKSPQKNHNRELNNSCEKNFIGGGGSNLRDKFRKFETSPYNNIKNRSNTTTIITAAAATFRTQSAEAADAHESVGENRRIYDDDKNSNFSTSLINCDERQRLKASAVQNNSNYSNNNNTIINKRCKFKFVNDSNNNQVKSSFKSSLPITSTANSAYKVDDNNIIHESQVPQTNILTDNDFSYIDSSSISRSSSTSFKSDEISVNENDENLKVRINNLRKYQIPKRITRISCDNNHTRDDAAADDQGSNKRFEIISTNENLIHRQSSIVNQSPSVENSVSQLMRKKKL